jgi:photosystem II stability/assembly factor-like uncharacterized protein
VTARALRAALAAALVLTLPCLPLGAQLVPDSATLRALRWRPIGPVNMAGRITSLAVHPRDPKTFYLAGATGGVWKTVNAGTTFFPVWEDGPIASLGDIAIAPSNPDIVWLGTGEADSRNSVAPGWGVYKSTDGGVTWQSVGLEKTQHVGRIVVHPTNPDVVYVAALGAQWGSNPERGLYKTTDAGRSWRWMNTENRRPFYFSEIMVDPKNPDRVYRLAVAFHQSEDGGRSWREGMLGIHDDYHTTWINPNDPDHFIVGGDAGVFQTFDRGGTYDALNNMPMGQFYGISYDYQVPYRVCGGLQDNGTSCGLSRRRGGQLQMTDGFALFAADGLQSAQNPFDPDIVYFESQGGMLMRRHLGTGQLDRIRPRTVTRNQFGNQIAQVRAQAAGKPLTAEQQLRRVQRVGGAHGATVDGPPVKALMATLGIGGIAQSLEPAVRTTVGGLAGGLSAACSARAQGTSLSSLLQSLTGDAGRA